MREYEFTIVDARGNRTLVRLNDGGLFKNGVQLKNVGEGPLRFLRFLADLGGGGRASNYGALAAAAGLQSGNDTPERSRINSLHGYASQLRGELGVLTPDHVFLKNVSREGYRLVPTVVIRSVGPKSLSVRTAIESVTQIHCNVRQTIIISGHGFGPYPEVVPVIGGGVDTIGESQKPSLAILNLGQGAHRWSAGRHTETNHCAIGLDLTSWTDSRIVLAGFTGPIGTSPAAKYQLSQGDPVKVVVFGPSNRCGPGGLPECPDEIKEGRVAVFDTKVGSPIADDTRWQS